MRHLARLLSMSLFLGACGAGTPAAPSMPTGPSASAGPASPAVPASPAAAGLSMVTISDSAFGTWLTGKAVDVAAADAYAELMEQDLGVTVTVRPFYYGGSTSGFVLDKVRSDESLRASLRSADVILFEVPIGELKELCPWDAGQYAPAPGTAAEYQACGAAMAQSYADDAAAIVDEIVSLRSPTEALVRTTDLWAFFHPTFEAMGVGPVVRENYRAINAGLARAAAAHGIPVAAANLAFMGPDGTTDPVAAGDVQPDQMHLTDQGVAKLAGLLRELGYGKASATPVP